MYPKDHAENGDKQRSVGKHACYPSSLLQASFQSFDGNAKRKRGGGKIKATTFVYFEALIALRRFPRSLPRVADQPGAVQLQGFVEFPSA